MGELHLVGKCQSGASPLQSIPLETGAPYPSLLNISLLQLTPSKQGKRSLEYKSLALGEGLMAWGLYAWWSHTP